MRGEENDKDGAKPVYEPVYCSPKKFTQISEESRNNKTLAALYPPSM